MAILVGGLGGAAAVAASLLGTALVCVAARWQMVRPRGQDRPSPDEPQPPAVGTG